MLRRFLTFLAKLFTQPRNDSPDYGTETDWLEHCGIVVVDDEDFRRGSSFHAAIHSPKGPRDHAC